MLTLAAPYCNVSGRWTDGWMDGRMVCATTGCDTDTGGGERYCIASICNTVNREQLKRLPSAIVAWSNVTLSCNSDFCWSWPGEYAAEPLSPAEGPWRKETWHWVWTTLFPRRQCLVLSSDGYRRNSMPLIPQSPPTQKKIAIHISVLNGVDAQNEHRLPEPFCFLSRTP